MAPVLDRLTQRIALLDEMARHDAAKGDHTRHLRAIISRLTLFKRMIGHLGVGATSSPLGDAVLHEAEASCFACGNARRCRAWLDAPGLDSAYHEFCDNAPLFDVLHRNGV